MTIAHYTDPQALAGRRMLIVEDEAILAMDLEMIFEDQGCEVLDPAFSVKRALALIETERPDGATLDMNLNGESSAPVAAALRERNIPFILLSGNTDQDEHDSAFRDAPFVKKPVETGELLRTIHLLFP
ncbi:response regulator [Loktanella sp. SALINAS62]|uniref:response regulator n=2 Tax=Loktanella sp. SALINAS62 TaxID=2706124 RepID=UPI001B8D285F|nr:response regulator [Loktanella sp. SALINAS62]